MKFWIMKVSGIFLTGMLSILQLAVADWIQPPLETLSGYYVPQPDYNPQLPRDHGSHPGYAIEWWYWVGHLKAVESSREFGFQSTVFRVEGDASSIGSKEQSALFGTQQLFTAHLSLSDLDAGQYVHEERVLREGWQAKVSTETLDLQVGPIIARWNVTDEWIEKKLALSDGRMLEMKLRPLKPLVVFGERGLSRKGADAEAVSWYWTYPRLAITGVLIEGDRRTEVSGIGWMDHETSSSQLGGNQEGWDWTAIQLDNGMEVKAYRLRTEAGKADPWSAIYWIDLQGKTRHAYAKDFEWKTGKVWKSERSGNSYPTEVTIYATHPDTEEKETYHLRPLLDNQEFAGNRADNAYWEGACAVFDGNNQRIGKAYLELFGYGDSMKRQLRR